jgi:hypothetical protein
VDDPVDELTITPWYDRPAFLARLIARVIRRRWPSWRGQEVSVAYRPHQWHSLLIRSGKKGRGLSVPLCKKWFRRVFKERIALYQDLLVLDAGSWHQAGREVRYLACYRPIWKRGAIRDLMREFRDEVHESDGSWRPI